MLPGLRDGLTRSFFRFASRVVVSFLSVAIVVGLAKGLVSLTFQDMLGRVLGELSRANLLFAASRRTPLPANRKSTAISENWPLDIHR